MPVEDLAYWIGEVCSWSLEGARQQVSGQNSVCTCVLLLAALRSKWHSQCQPAQYSWSSLWWLSADAWCQDSVLGCHDYSSVKNKCIHLMHTLLCIKWFNLQSRDQMHRIWLVEGHMISTNNIKIIYQAITTCFNHSSIYPIQLCMTFLPSSPSKNSDTSDQYGRRIWYVTIEVNVDWRLVLRLHASILSFEMQLNRPHQVQCGD